MKTDFDVVINGFGPAGATLACLLGAQGVRTLVVDRLTGVYDKPRAFAMDHEVMRVFQNLGLAEAIGPHIAPFTASEHYGVDGQLIRRLTMIEPPYPLGWIPSMVFRQPPLEAALRARANAMPGVTVAPGEELVSLSQTADQVNVMLERDGASREVTARYLVGCDGASSTVRRILGIDHDDLDFDEPWLVVDVGVTAQGAAKLPVTNAQFCEPARPTTFLVGVGEHRRWEIMLMPGETPQDFESDVAVWKLLSRWITPDDGKLWRRASYRFHALVASRWRVGRVFLAGDAAHQQPPFLGQGMCQGVRDVSNLAWKLQQVIAGKAGKATAALLETYGQERGAHVRQLTNTIKGIGRYICERDPIAARERDARLVAEAGGTVKSQPRQDLIPGLKVGLLSGLDHPSASAHPAQPAPTAPPPHPAVGTLFPQPRVLQNGQPVLLDDAAGSGWRIVLGDAALGWSPTAGTGYALLRVTTTPQRGAWAETEGVLAGWFQRHACAAAIVRPDHYVYAVAATAHALQAELAALALNLA